MFTVHVSFDGGFMGNAAYCGGLELQRCSVVGSLWVQKVQQYKTTQDCLGQTNRLPSTTTNKQLVQPAGSRLLPISDDSPSALIGGILVRGFWPLILGSAVGSV
jgi:hypothetical protein